MIKLHAQPQEPLKNEEIYTLFGNIDLILSHKEQILQNEDYKNICVKGTGIDGIYVGHIDLFLGDLLNLWEKTDWRDQRKFYYHLGGSPLSGMSFCTYWEGGKIDYDRNKPSFCTLLRPACAKIEDKQPTGVIQLPEVKRKASPLRIADLVRQLER